MASRITVEQSGEGLRGLWDRVEAARAAGDDVAELDACWALLEHPCAPHQVVEHEVLDEIHHALRRLGRCDEAIQAKREANDADYRSNPDPEADIAECLVDAGRREEAGALFAELRRRDPDDVWLYNSAGWAYARVDDREPLRWLREGMRVAIDTGDAEQVMGQLLGMAQECWDRLDEAHDADLVAQVEAFERDWVRRPIARRSRAGAPRSSDTSAGVATAGSSLIDRLGRRRPGRDRRGARRRRWWWPSPGSPRRSGPRRSRSGRISPRASIRPMRTTIAPRPAGSGSRATDPGSRCRSRRCGSMS